VDVSIAYRPAIEKFVQCFFFK
jgi:hypothetical protein